MNLHPMSKVTIHYNRDRIYQFPLLDEYTRSQKDIQKGLLWRIRRSRTGSYTECDFGMCSRSALHVLAVAVLPDMDIAYVKHCPNFYRLCPWVQRSPRPSH
jgi:hypothetical protein